MKKIFLCLFAAFVLITALPLISFDGNSATDDNGSNESFIDQSSCDTEASSVVPSDTSLPIFFYSSSDSFSFPSLQKSTNHSSEILSSNNELSLPTPSETGISDQSSKNLSHRSFKILDTHSGEIVTVDDYTFCCGALAYELPPSFEKEALKAQCIACYTHFSRLRMKQQLSPDTDLKGADFAADLSENEFYFSDIELKRKWGILYESSINSIKGAVDDVSGLVMLNENGQLVDAAYHSISSGATEDAKDVFGGENPNLRSVSSPGDMLANGYRTEVRVSTNKFRKTILNADSKNHLSDPPEKWIGNSEQTNSGYVKSVKIGSGDYNGQMVRDLFSLRSPNFTISYNNDEFIFTVLGYGHGVGMSQYGANYMAQQGADYKQILHHYYNGISISDLP